MASAVVELGKDDDGPLTMTARISTTSRAEALAFAALVKAYAETMPLETIA